MPLPDEKTMLRLRAASQLIGEKRWYEAARVIWPWTRANPLTEKIYQRLSEHRNLAIIGHAASSKTFSVTQYMALRWLAAPKTTGVLLTAPTLASLKSRAWTYVKQLWDRVAIPLHGEVVNYEMKVRLYKADDLHNILCVAGDADNSEHKIRGFHPENLFVMIDEADNPFSEAIWEALPNLRATGEVQVVAMTNPTKRHTRFGSWCEPPLGWSSVLIDRDKEWEAASGAHTLRLDGVDSPNIVAGEDVFKFLLTMQGKRDYEKEGVNSPAYLKYFRAWFPDDGAVKLVFPSEIIDRMQQIALKFYSDSFGCYGIDPAYSEEGDECVVIIGDCGRLASNPKKTIIKYRTGVRVERKDKTKLVTEDLGDQIIEVLKEHKVRGDLGACDATGSGLAISDYIRAKWNRDMLAVGFGGKPSETRILAEDTKSCEERFDRFVTELWFAARDWARAGLLSAPQLPRRLRIDLEARQYEDVSRDRKIAIETKTDMRSRGLKSPDWGDAFCLMVHAVRLRFSDALPVIVDEPVKHKRRMAPTTFNQVYDEGTAVPVE